MVTNIRAARANGTEVNYGIMAVQEMQSVNYAAGFGPASTQTELFSDKPFICVDPAPPAPSEFKFGTGARPKDLSITQRPSGAGGGTRLAFFGARAPALRPGKQVVQWVFACDYRANFTWTSDTPPPPGFEAPAPVAVGLSSTPRRSSKRGLGQVGNVLTGEFPICSDAHELRAHSNTSRT